ncbi:MAG: hypothetical protein ABIQ93_05305, partial [Saprospiraceae bacterium]
MKNLSLLALFLVLAYPAFSQATKNQPASSGKIYSPEQLRLQWPGKAAVPAAENPFGAPAVTHQPLPALQRLAAGAPKVRITQGENGMPILFQGKTAASGSSADNKPLAARALEYCASLQPAGIADPAKEFITGAATTDEQGNTHVRLQQVYQGLPVYGGEVIAHTDNGSFHLLNGRYYPTPKLASVTPVLNAEAAMQQVKNVIGLDKVKTNWTPNELRLIDGPPFAASLMVYHPHRDLHAERLAWVVTAHPNIVTRTIYFVDANSGEIIHHFEQMCKIDGGLLGHASGARSEQVVAEPEAAVVPAAAPWVVDGPVTASGQDLLNINRTFGAYQIGSQVVLEDASKAMFNATESNMPNDPVGALVTLTAKNTSPAVQQAFDYDFTVSASTVFSDKNAVSTHWNGSQSFDYYKN